MASSWDKIRGPLSTRETSALRDVAVAKGLVDPANARLYTVILAFATHHSFQLNEVCALRIEDLNLSKKRSSVRVHGRKEGREVTLARELRDLLSEHIALLKEERKRRSERPPERILESASGAPLSPRDIERILGELLRIAGIPNI